MNNLTNITPLDGRYQNKVKDLEMYFSEMALQKFRLLVEIEYFISLSKESKIKELKTFSTADQKKLRKIYEDFSLSDSKKIKTIENTTNHDVKAVEYFLKEKLPKNLQKYSEFIHFGLTSEDTNNLSFSLMLKEGIDRVSIPQIELNLKELKSLAKKQASTPLLSLTHGQPATPTTLGKEIAVFYNRINRNLNHLKTIKLDGKFSGATGNFAAMQVAYPEINWIGFSKKFITSLGLQPNLLTTQIEPHDSMCMMLDAIARINSVFKDLNQDMWLYISRGIFKLKKIKGEVGSSTMPHKVNPINFENSEGNLGLANSMLRYMSDKLPISRMQRDLTDSTTLRNQGVALGYSLLAYKNTLVGLQKLEVNKNSIHEELNNHWEVLAEPIQTVLRKLGVEKPYEKLKALTQGEEITKETIANFIKNLNITETEKEKLLKLTPANYIGLSKELTKLI